MTSIEWEYKDYVYRAWQPTDIYSCVTYSGKSWECDAREFFWDIAAGAISAELQPWLSAGWESIGAIGPDAIMVSQSERRDSTNHPSDILLWIMTLGIAFVFQHLWHVPRYISVYEPVEFRVRMRRPMPVQTALTNDERVLA